MRLAKVIIGAVIGISPFLYFESITSDQAVALFVGIVLGSLIKA